MQVDVLIIGQGISGTMLSWFLHKARKSFIVIDDNNTDAPSHVAAGIINPVTGRRFVYTWMIDTLLPFAMATYKEIGQFFDSELIQRKDILDFFPSAQMLDAFATRVTENDTYLHSYPNQNHFNPVFNYDFGCGRIGPCYIVDTASLLLKWRTYLKQNNLLLEETFDITGLEMKEEHVTFRNITAKKIVFSDGLQSMNYDWFNLLPFSPNKGEVLIIESPELPPDFIYKKGLMLAPLGNPGIYWVGSSYQWEFEQPGPTPQFLANTKAALDSWLKHPYKIVDHKAAVRPATLERRPFVGFHPLHPQIGILNGMGTKGASLAPYFADQLAHNIVSGTPIMPEADVKRFSRILAK
ncbi:MAG TPA: FAD-binding oxidoreductase [Chitinophagaceae bacterium]|nr:FAD-binding oxidoreductase [Chitinophagaceae bacterium]